MSLEPVHQALHEALRNRLDIVSDRELYERDPALHLERLREASSRLDAIVGALPAGTDPRLRHFLERQSFLKALEWLETAGIS